MGEPEDHHDVLVAGVGDGVPDSRWNVQRLTGVEAGRAGIGTDFALTREHVCDLFHLVRHHPSGCPGREDRVAERAGDLGHRLAGEDHPAPAPIREGNRIDLILRDDSDRRLVYSAHLPSLTMYWPVSSIRSEAFRQLPSRWSVLTFCPPG